MSGLDSFNVSAFECFLDSVDLCFNICLIRSVHLVAEVIQTLLALECKLVSSISCVNLVLLLLVLSCKSFRFLNSLVDVVLGHIGGRSDSDVLLLACA